MKNVSWVLAVAIAGAFLGMSRPAHAYCPDLDGDGLRDSVTFKSDTPGVVHIYSGNGSYAAYRPAAWTSFQYLELDGFAGCELAFFSSDRVSVITHRIRKLDAYVMGTGYRHVGTLETDGVAGNELIIHNSSPATTVRIISHRSYAVRTHNLPSNQGFTYSNQDGRPGTELIYYVPGTLGFVINDALRTTYYL